MELVDNVDSEVPTVKTEIVSRVVSLSLNIAACHMQLKKFAEALAVSKKACT